MFSTLTSWASNDPAFPTATKDGDADTSLASILPTPALRIELAVLVFLSIDQMRRDHVATFQAPNTVTTTTSASLHSTDTPLPSVEEHLQNIKGPIAESAAVEARIQREREQELGGLETQQLRQTTLSFFNQWRLSVLRRVGEVLGVRGEEVRLAKARRATTPVVVPAEGDKLYSDWTHQKEERKDEAGKQDVSSQTNRISVLKRYVSVQTDLVQLDESKRALILNCLLLLLLSLEKYSAHSRVLLLHLTHSLHLSVSTLSEHEKAIAQGLLATASSHMSAEESTKQKAADDSAARKWKVGIATVAGAALIGVTGGLAAPFLMAGVGTIMGGLGLGVVSSYLGALAGSSVLIGGLFGAYGGRMTGRMMEKYAKEVEDFKFMPIKDSTISISEPPTDTPATSDYETISPNINQSRRLRVVIGISGWLNSPSDVLSPWCVLNSATIEPFALRYELDSLLTLGTSLSSVFKSYAWSCAKIELVRRTVLSSLAIGLWPLSLLKAARVLDNPFSVALARSDKAGMVLAHALANKAQGERPVTLVGYSLGARVVWRCLKELADKGAFGLIEDVVLMGAPVPIEGDGWTKVRAAVAGRVINAYSADDWILGYLYRTSSIRFGVAGLQEVQGVNGVESINVTGLVKGHTRWKAVVGQVLERVGFLDLDVEEVERERGTLDSLNEGEKSDALQAKGFVEAQIEEDAVKLDDDWDWEDNVEEGADGRIVMIDMEVSKNVTRSVEVADAIVVKGTQGKLHSMGTVEVKESRPRVESSTIDKAQGADGLIYLVPEPIED